MTMNVGLSLSSRNIETKLLAPRQEAISFVETSSFLSFNFVFCHEVLERFNSRDLIFAFSSVSS